MPILPVLSVVKRHDQLCDVRMLTYVPDRYQLQVFLYFEAMRVCGDISFDVSAMADQVNIHVCAAHRLCTLGTCVAKLFQQSICRTILNVSLHSHIFPPSPLLAGSSPSQDLLAGQPRHHGTLCERGHPAQVKN